MGINIAELQWRVKCLGFVAGNYHRVEIPSIVPMFDLDKESEVAHNSSPSSSIPVSSKQLTHFLDV
jgi:hypothetical protein